MKEIIIGAILAIVAFAVIRILINISKGREYTNGESSRNHGTNGSIKKNSRFSPRLFSDFLQSPLPYDNNAITWCAGFLSVEEDELKKILRTLPWQYNSFGLRKRTGGYRTISAPKNDLLAIQRTIYHRILLPVAIHPAATGFRNGMSILDNVKPHLGKKEVLKTDIVDFFGSVSRRMVVRAFRKIGYPPAISKVLAALCCLNRHLPQGAPTSPALSNIIAYELDRKLTDVSHQYGVVYTRYADDMTFSGHSMDAEGLESAVNVILNEEGFRMKHRKTRFLNGNKRKIITGISVSSGKKMTIPRAKKRELRKNIHFILTKGLKEHQRYIGSTDPVYLKRLIGYLNFWLLVEPENKYVIDSLYALRKLER